MLASAFISQASTIVPPSSPGKSGSIPSLDQESETEVLGKLGNLLTRGDHWRVRFTS